MILRTIAERIYSDFLMPSRLEEYRSLLRLALEKGYDTHSVISFWCETQASSLRIDRRYLVLRHDVDSDVGTAKAIWSIEREMGVRSSFYFRRATADVHFMQAIERSGSEASYHYEELSTFTKRNGLRRRDLPHYTSIMQSIFRRNLLQLREQTGLPMLTVASHGDFVNRRLGVLNTTILADPAVRRELGIVLEAYDEEATARVTMRCADCGAPRHWRSCDPVEGLRRGEFALYVLTHPKHWRVNWRDNAFLGLSRLAEEVWYSVRVLLPHSSHAADL